jgi:hypothetical protein
MPLEQDLQANTAAMNRLHDKLDEFLSKTGIGAGAAAPAASTKPAGGKKNEKAASKYTPEQIHEMATKVKDEKGSEAAKELISATGVKNLAELKTKPDLFDAFVAACEAALNDDDSL